MVTISCIESISVTIFFLEYTQVFPTTCNQDVSTLARPSVLQKERTHALLSDGLERPCRDSVVSHIEEQTLPV